MGTFIITFASLFAVLGRPGAEGDAAVPGSLAAGAAAGSSTVFAALAGLSISFALQVTQSLNWSVRMASDLESQMVAVERLSEYSTMEQEAPHYAPSHYQAVQRQLQEAGVSVDQPTLGEGAAAAAAAAASGGGSAVAEVPHNWPHTGAITLRDVTMRYRAGLPLVLKGLNLKIRGGEKVGV